MADITKLSIDDTRFLAELEKTGVLLRAGLLLNLSPSSSSRNFSRIRSYFPQEIFRQMEGLWVPTNYYLQIKPQIHQILEASEAMMDMQFDPSQSTRTFVLSSVMTEISVVISGVLPKMIERAPKVRLDLSKHDNEIAAVSEGKADFAVITDVDLAPDLHRMKLYPLDRVLLVRKGHPLTQLKRPLLTRYLQVYDRVSIRTGRSASWVGPEQGLFQYERFMEHTRFSTSRFYSAWGAIEKTNLISVCGWRAAELAMKAYKLTALPLPIDFEETEKWNVLIWSDSKHRDPAHKWMRGLFKEWAIEDAERMKKLKEKDLGVPKYK